MIQNIILIGALGSVVKMQMSHPIILDRTYGTSFDKIHPNMIQIYGGRLSGGRGGVYNLDENSTR